MAGNRATKWLILSLWLIPSLAWARDKPQEWTEVRSPHFVVATNGSEKQGRRIADQFERMRSVFHAAFPKLQIDPGAPIVVLAIKDEKEFRALEPEAYLAKGQLKLAGLFLRAPDKNYVLMRLDAEGDHPYSVVYHEYTHLLLSKAAEWIPLWMNEGLAEFYQTTDIREKEALLGQPSVENLTLLRENPLLPLATLLTVNEKSPYYHEENKGYIFYAESWALMHYIQTKGHKENSDELKHYSELLIKGTDPLSAATAAFGDLKQLQSELRSYVQETRFVYFRLNTTTEVDDSAFKVQALTAAQSDALRADFLAYNQRFADAKSLLDQTLKEDPNNVSAHETMGFLEFRQGHLKEAQDWYAQAVKLDSQNYLAHYYNAAIAMIQGPSSANDPQVESSLRTAIKLNPSFAPSYDRLAMLLGMSHRNLDEARMMSLNAIGLDPSNVPYRLNMANIWLELQNFHNAVQVLQTAAKVAKTPQDSEAVDNMLRRVQLYSDEQAQARELASDDDDSSAPKDPTPQAVDQVEERTRPHDFVPFGPHHFLTGALKNVHCKYQQIDLIVESSGQKLALHSDNYYKIQFTSLGFTPSGELHPCQDLEGHPGKVEYVESADKTATAHVLSVELHK
jgi:Tfp pilus assembly protein PilF